MSAWKWIGRICVWMAVGVLALQVADRWARRTGPLPELPEPNGYAVLLRVARATDIPEGALLDMPPEKVRSWAADRREDLQSIRMALRGETAVPLSSDPGQAQAQADEIRQIKRLAVLIGIRMRSEMLDGQTNAAAISTLDTILLGQAMAHGGLVVHALNAMAVERVGVATLRTLAPGLDGNTCMNLARVLEEAETRRESVDRILQTELTWRQASFGLVGRLMQSINGRAETQRRLDFITRHQETAKATRKLMLDLAIRAASQKTSQPVPTASEVVPSILKAIPVDPKTGTPIEP